MFFYFPFLNIHKKLKIVYITPHGPDDGSAEPKRYSVDLSINHFFHLNRCYQFFYIYIYIERKKERREREREREKMESFLSN